MILAVASGIAITFIVFILSFGIGTVLGPGVNETLTILGAISILCGTVFSCTLLLTEEIRNLRRKSDTR